MAGQFALNNPEYLRDLHIGDHGLRFFVKLNEFVPKPSELLLGRLMALS